jgi:adenine-specific DNA-methyltransferase
VTERERYGLSWAGKSEAIRNIQTPSVATLVPDPEGSVQFDSTENLFIEGDNLEALKLLQKSYHGQIKMIYIDPPYNTGHEFIYPDNFHEGIDDYLRYSGQVNGDGLQLSTNTETSGRYHSKWLSMMYPRIFLARNLLREDGVIFVSIDDHEVHNLRMLLDEVFGEENFVAQIEWQKRYTRSNNTDAFTSVIDHVLLYCKSDAFAPNLLKRDAEADARYSNPDNDPRGPWKAIPFLNPLSPKERPNLCYPITNPTTGKQIVPDRKAWRSSKSVFEEHVKEGRVWWGQDGTASTPNIKRFLSEVRQGMTPINFWEHSYAGNTDQANDEIKTLFGDKVFDTPKPSTLVRRMIEHSCDKSSLVLDFFAGSGTTAHAVLDLNREDEGNRRFIMVQLPEPTDNPDYPTIADIGKERIRRVIKKLNGEEDGKLRPEDAPPQDRGFKVFKLTSSNFKIWDGTEASGEPEDLAEQLRAFAENVLPDRSREDILYEILLKSGLPLTAEVERLDVAGREVYAVSGGLLMVCLEDHVDEDLVRAVAGLEPQRFVCLDAAFDGNNKLKTNAVLQMKDSGIEFRTV